MPVERPWCPFPSERKCRSCACRRRCPFEFGSPRSLDRFRRAKSLRTVRAGELLFREGEKPRGLFALCTGYLRLFKTGRGSDQATLRYVSCGELVGAAPLAARRPHCASAEAVIDSTLCFVPSAVVRRLLSSDKAFVEAVFRSLGAMVQGLSAHAADLALQSADARLARFLLSVPRHGGDGQAAYGCAAEPRYSRSEISRCVGVARETVIRRLTSFERRGLIRLDGRKVVILDRPKLQRVLVES